MQPSINFRPPLKQNPVFHEGDFESTSYIFPYARKILKFSKLLVMKFFTAPLNCTGICILYTPVCLLYIPVFCIRFSQLAIPYTAKLSSGKTFAVVHKTHHSLENFRGASGPCHYVLYTANDSRGKRSRLAKKPQKPRKFSHSKILPYTVYDCTIIPHRRKIWRDKSLENFLQ